MATWKVLFHSKYNKQGYFLYAEEKADVIKRELELCGYFCIITSEKMTASEALIHYKGRDMSEQQWAIPSGLRSNRKVILSAFGISEEDVRSSAAEIGKLLADNQLLINNQPKEDEEDGTDETD